MKLRQLLRFACNVASRESGVKKSPSLRTGLRTPRRGRRVCAAGNCEISISSFGFRVSSFGFRVSSFEFQISNFEFQISNFEFPISSFLLRDNKFSCGVCFIVYTKFCDVAAVFNFIYIPINKCLVGVHAKLFYYVSGAIINLQ